MIGKGLIMRQRETGRPGRKRGHFFGFAGEKIERNYGARIEVFPVLCRPHRMSPRSILGNFGFFVSRKLEFSN